METPPRPGYASFARKDDDFLTQHRQLMQQLELYPPTTPRPSGRRSEQGHYSASSSVPLPTYPGASGSTDSVGELRAQMRLLRSEVEAKEYIAADLRQQVTGLLQQRHDARDFPQYGRRDSMAEPPHMYRPSPPSSEWHGHSSERRFEAQLVHAEEERLATQRRLAAQVAQADDLRREAEAALEEERERRQATDAQVRMCIFFVFL